MPGLGRFLLALSRDGSAVALERAKKIGHWLRLKPVLVRSGPCANSLVDFPSGSRLGRVVRQPETRTKTERLLNRPVRVALPGEPTGRGNARQGKENPVRFYVYFIVVSAIALLCVYGPAIIVKERSPFAPALLLPFLYAVVSAAHIFSFGADILEASKTTRMRSCILYREVH